MFVAYQAGDQNINHSITFNNLIVMSIIVAVTMLIMFYFRNDDLN